MRVLHRHRPSEIKAGGILIMPNLMTQAKNAGMNSGGTLLAKVVKLTELKKHPELETVFVINTEVLAKIVESMKENGYDKGQPVVIWKGENYIVDGYTRYAAAQEAEIDEIPVHEKEFENVEEAMRYCYRRQAERRNLTAAEIYNVATRLQIPIVEIAQELKISESTVKRVKKIEKEANEEDIEDIKNNKASINEVYKKIRKPKEQKPENEKKPKGAIAEGTEQQPETDIVISTEIEGTDILDSAIEVETSETDNDEKEDDPRLTGCIKYIIEFLLISDEISAARRIYNDCEIPFDEKLVLKLLPEDLKTKLLGGEA
jgi:ParB-like chromosome segregation protein Spo0J